MYKGPSEVPFVKTSAELTQKKKKSWGIMFYVITLNNCQARRGSVNTSENWIPTQHYNALHTQRSI